MRDAIPFLRLVLNAITKKVVVIAPAGWITYTHRGRDDSGNANNAPTDTDWHE